MKIRTEKIIDLNEWDELVSETYSRPYSFQQQDGCKERGMYWLTIPDHGYDYEEDMVEEIPEVVNHGIMGVKFYKWLERDPKQPLKNQEYDWELEMWWERNFYPHIQTVANDLYEKGLIEAGEYGIEIDW